jgi:predicted ATPase/DNA-binding winged helix-turn-helix (wHTH) protein
MDILLCLLERQGDVVSSNELLASVWRGLNVEQTALRAQISVLRKALAGADPGDRYVSNVAGRGYCFVAPVLRKTDSTSTAPRDSEQRPAPPPTLRRMVGRDTVLDDLEGTIATERFVTLVGPGGIGKTTVALALAERVSPAFDGDVVFVDLGVQKGDHSVAGAVATALRLNRLEGDPVADIILQLRSRRPLLILDSCEHVIAGAAALAEAICQSAPQCYVVATSREPLNALGERVHRLGALETPPLSETLSFEEVCGYPAAQLFIDRLSATGAKIENRPADALLVADICRKLDGIPLAIELAAGRVASFGLATTYALLDSRLRLSWPGRRTALPRHVTLSATLDWSYDLLSPEEAKLLRALSVFAGSFPLDAAMAVADDSLRADTPEALAGLIAKSLASADRGRTPVQYRLLDTTRDYARLKLEAAGELPVAAARHAGWTLGDLRKQEAQREAPPTPEWLDYVGNRIQDAQSALDWSLSEMGDPSVTVPLMLASVPIWEALNRFEEIRRRSEAALRVVEPDSRDEMLLNIELAAQSYETNVRGGEIAASRALELATAFDDLHCQVRARLWLWNAYIGIRPNLATAQEHAGLFRELAELRGGPSEQMLAECMVGVSELVAGDLAVAHASNDRAQALSRSPAPDPDYVVPLLYNTRVSLLWLEGMPDTATALAQVNLDRAQATGLSGVRAPVLADACGGVAMYVGDLTAADRYADMLDDCVADGAWYAYRTWAQVLRATIAAQRGDAGPGRLFVTRGLPLESGHPRFAGVLTELALRLGAVGAEDVARALADRLLQRIEGTGERYIWSEVQRVRGELSREAAEAEALFEAALAVAQQQGARAWALRAATSLARRRRSAAEEVLAPLLASFTEGRATQDHIEASAVLSEYGLSPQ